MNLPSKDLYVSHGHQRNISVQCDWRRPLEIVYVALLSFHICIFFSYVASCHFKVLLHKLDEAILIMLLICGFLGWYFCWMVEPIHWEVIEDHVRLDSLSFLSYIRDTITNSKYLY